MLTFAFKTTNVVISRFFFFAEDGIIQRCVPHVQHAYFFNIRPIKFLIYEVVIPVDVVMLTQ